MLLFVEMLHKFTEEETLEGKIYRCEKCNGRFSSTAENLWKWIFYLIWYFLIYTIYTNYTCVLFYTLKTHFTFYTVFSSQKVKIIKPDLFRGSQKTTAEETAKCVKTSPQKIQFGVTQYFLVWQCQIGKIYKTIMSVYRDLHIKSLVHNALICKSNVIQVQVYFDTYVQH